MKFGSRLPFQQIPQWADEYIDYDSLKERLKTDTINSQSTRDSVLKLLRQEQKRVDAFLEQKFSALKQSIEEVENRFTTTPTNSARFLAIKQSLLELCVAIKELDSFAKTNLYIASRIRSKSKITLAEEEARGASMAQEAPTLYTRPWLSNVSTGKMLKDIPKKQTYTAEADSKTALFEAVTKFYVDGAFSSRDERGRLPLHYAAAYGFRDHCALILQRTGSAGCLQPDKFGDTPFSLAVAMGNASIVELFLSILRPSPTTSMPEGLVGRMLQLAIQADRIDVSRALINTGHELDFSGKSNATPLYLAARRHQVEVVRLLLQSSVNINSRNSARQWTPLIVASAYGYQDVVKELVEAGADVSAVDRRNWTAADHAAYRGHPKTIQELQHQSQGLEHPTSAQPKSPALALSPTRTITSRNEENDKPLLNTDFSHVFVNIGSFDLYKTTQIIDLDPYTDALSSERLPNTSMALEVSAFGCGEKYCVQLPILEDLSNSPWSFSTRTPDIVRLVFKILNTHAPQNPVICSGVALLSELARGLGPHRSTVGSDYAIPLVCQTGEYAGSLNFTFIVARPVTPPSVVLQKREMHSSGITQVGAHRGLGQNTKSREHLQIGENTMQSFESAIKLGASFIEFDVQVTKDFVPTIYHDFLVSETGTDATMHTLSYAQFMALSKAQAPAREPQEGHTARFPWDERDRPRQSQHRRSRSLCATHSHGTAALFERRYAADF